MLRVRTSTVNKTFERWYQDFFFLMERKKPQASTSFLLRENRAIYIRSGEFTKKLRYTIETKKRIGGKALSHFSISRL